MRCDYPSTTTTTRATTGKPPFTVDVSDQGATDEGDVDDSETTEFQTDDRPIEEGRTTRSSAVPESASTSRPTTASSRQRSSRPEASGRRFGRSVARERPTTGRSGTSGQSTDDQSHRRAGTRQESPARDGQVPYERVHSVASKVMGTRRPHIVQVRRPWSEEATGRLIDLIEDGRYGTCWSLIEGLKDPLLEGRGQVALKDKARNIKVDFLKYISLVIATLSGEGG